MKGHDCGAEVNEAEASAPSLHLTPGLDYPDVFGFWSVAQLMAVASVLMVFILLQAVLMGVVLAVFLLLRCQTRVGATVRGRWLHQFWRWGGLSQAIWLRWPPAQVTWFDG